MTVLSRYLVRFLELRGAVDRERVRRSDEDLRACDSKRLQK